MLGLDSFNKSIPDMEISAVPESNDVTTLRDQLLTANTSEITITTESDVTTTSTTAAATLTSSY